MVLPPVLVVVRSLLDALIQQRDLAVAARLGLAEDHAYALCGWSAAASPRTGESPLTLWFAQWLATSRLPRQLKLPAAGEALPIHAVRFDAPPEAHTWMRAHNSTNHALEGTLGALLRLDSEPNRVLALTAGHVCGASRRAARGDLLRFELDDGSAAFEGPLLDWQPNFQRLAGGCDIDAGIAELDVEDVASLATRADVLPTGSAPLRGGDVLRLRTRGRQITGGQAEFTSVRLSVGGDGRYEYLLRQAFSWRPSESTQQGDSGAPVWNARDELVAIHAGGGSVHGQPVAFAVPIAPVLRWVGASVLRRGEGLRQSAPPAGLQAVAPTAIAGAPPLSPTSPADAEIDTLARTMWAEARRDGAGGMSAVAHVVFNRVAATSWWGRTVVDVCRKPWQFSCWNANDPNLPKLLDVSGRDAAFALAVRLAEELRSADRAGTRVRADPTNGATHYYARALIRKPRWAVGREPVARIGGHDFFAGIA